MTLPLIPLAHFKTPWPPPSNPSAALLAHERCAIWWCVIHQHPLISVPWGQGGGRWGLSVAGTGKQREGRKEGGKASPHQHQLDTATTKTLKTLLHITPLTFSRPRPRCEDAEHQASCWTLLTGLKEPINTGITKKKIVMREKREDTSFLCQVVAVYRLFTIELLNSRPAMLTARDISSCW